MCGIIGINSNKPVSASIINSLKKLEYRGYDSAGLATLDNDIINEKKCSGRVEELEKILFKTPLNGNVGIGVTPSNDLHILGKDTDTSTGITIQTDDTANAKAAITLMSRNSSNVNQTANITNNDGTVEFDTTAQFLTSSIHNFF